MVFFYKALYYFLHGTSYKNPLLKNFRIKRGKLGIFQILNLYFIDFEVGLLIGRSQIR